MKYKKQITLTLMRTKYLLIKLIDYELIKNITINIIIWDFINN